MMLLLERDDSNEFFSPALIGIESRLKWEREIEMTIDVNWKENIYFLSIANSQPVFFLLLFGCHFLPLCLRGEIRFVIGSLVHFGWNFERRFFFFWCIEDQRSEMARAMMMVDDGSFCCFGFCLMSRDSGVICIIFRLVCTAGRVTNIHLLCELWGWPIDLLFYMLHGANVTTDSQQHITRGAGLLAGALYSSIRYYYFIRSRSLPSNPSDGALYTTYILSLDSVGHVPPPRRGSSSSLLIRRSRAIQINSLLHI